MVTLFIHLILRTVPNKKSWTKLARSKYDNSLTKSNAKYYGKGPEVLGSHEHILGFPNLTGRDQIHVDLVNGLHNLMYERFISYRKTRTDFYIENPFVGNATHAPRGRSTWGPNCTL